MSKVVELARLTNSATAEREAALARSRKRSEAKRAGIAQCR